jgi:hypothetical protein
MSTIERLYAPISDRSRPRISTVVPDGKEDAIALRQRVAAVSDIAGQSRLDTFVDGMIMNHDIVTS